MDGVFCHVLAYQRHISCVGELCHWGEFILWMGRLFTWPAELLMSENPLAGERRYMAGDIRAKETMVHETCEFGLAKLFFAGLAELKIWWLHWLAKNLNCQV